MNEAEASERTGLRKWFNVNLLGIALVAGAMILSLVRVMTIRKTLFDPNKTIIRIAHWQLELGYRQALQAVIDEYEERHPGVKVVQMPVTERIYGQWLNTHLLSGTAPDLAELGYAKLASDTQYLARFFLPLTELIDEPNPYNAGTEIADWAWRETFIDGMRGGYRIELQDYFSAPTSMFTVRIYCNLDLLYRITGSKQPPRSMGELLNVCAAVKSFAQQAGRRDQLVPIAGSRYNAVALTSRYLVPFTAGLETELDTNLDGTISGDETYAAFVAGKVGYDHPSIRAYYECTRMLSEQFNPGFMSMGREDATFMFIQENAVMVCSGSWDANSLFKQAEFEVGVFDLPLPVAGERWGEQIAGRGNEAGTAGGGKYGVTKHSEHVDQAIDFLRFLTSRKYNGLFNEGASWLPVIVGTEPAERMAPFMPDPSGYASSVSLAYGTLAGTALGGQEWKFYSGEIEYQDLAETVTAAIRDPDLGGDRAWAMAYDVKRRWCRNQDRVLAVQSTRALLDADAADAPAKFRRALLQQLRFNNGDELRYRFETTRGRSIEALVD